MEQNYTIKDIAKLAGVSIGTVDRVLHERGRVSKQALVKVKKVLEKTGYRPNPIAKSLRVNKNYNISIILPEASFDPYWLPCYDVIEKIDKEFRYFGIKMNLCTFNPNSTESFVSTALEVVKDKPDAILMVPLFYYEAEMIAKKCVDNQIIVATFNNYIKNSEVNLVIGQDLFQSGQVAAKLFDLLLKPNSHIVVAHIDESFRNASHMQEKEYGFKNYFTEKSKSQHTIEVKNFEKRDTLSFEKNVKNFLETSESIDAVFVTTSKAYLIANQVSSYSKNTIIIGYDLVEDNLNHLNNGNVTFLLHQDPRKQIQLSLNCLIEYFLFDKPLQKQFLLPIDIVNSENYPQYLI